MTAARLAEIDAAVWRLRSSYLAAEWALEPVKALEIADEVDELLRERWQIQPHAATTLPG